MIAPPHIRRVGPIVMALLLALLIDGCIRSRRVDIDDLLSSPERYHGREICTEGIHLSGFEASALGVSTYQIGGAVYITQPAIWIERADIRSRSDCFETQTTPRAKFCRATVCGLFEYGGDYGHGGAYEYQLRGTID